jgi:hypothetical protein
VTAGSIDDASATVPAPPPAAPAPALVAVPALAGLPDEEEGAEEVTAAGGTSTRSAEANESGWGVVNVSLTYSVSLGG